jgi:23S rRNA pseudouridine2604 synthase
MDQEHISLNKYISESGLCSRREADKLIEAGRVKLNDTIARKGNRATALDKVYVDDELVVKKVKPVYILLNKPVGITCTTDQRDADNIIDYIKYEERIFPVGRLDKMSQGLILLTNDGDIVNKILRAGNEHEKEYIVTVNKPIDEAFLKSMSVGIPILDTVTSPCYVEMIDNYKFKIILTQGLNRQIRRMCEFLDFRVTSLNRVRIMHLDLSEIEYGKWRFINGKEYDKLLELVENSSK